MSPALDCPWILFAELGCHIFYFLFEGCFPIVLSFPLCPVVLWTRTAGEGLVLWGFVGSVTALPTEGQVGAEGHHSPFLYHTACLKPQYKHRGPSQNEFVSKSGLAGIMVPEHECTGWAGVVHGGAVCCWGPSSWSLVMGVSVFAHMLRLSALAVVTYCAGFFWTYFEV